MPTYYDYILGLIPISFIGLTGLLYLVGVSIMSALPIAGVLAVTLVGHALFVNGPVDPAPIKKTDSHPRTTDGNYKNRAAPDPIPGGDSSPSR